MIYLDTSVVVPLFLDDVHSERVSTWFAGLDEPPILSPWTIAEFSSAVAGLCRMNLLGEDERLEAERSFDGWIASVQRAPVLTADFDSAREMIRFDRAPLRTPDALHVAITRRLDHSLATLDAAMAGAAKRLGVRIAAI